MTAIINKSEQFRHSDFTILIVDDNPANLGVLSDYLEALGFYIVVATDGETALERAAHVQPDIILLDVLMPGIDGFETCRRLKANEATSHISVIFLTALTSTEDRVHGFTAGGVDYISKPIQTQEVLVRVVTHLTIRSSQLRLEAANAELSAARSALETLNAELESRVARRTAELNTANLHLRESERTFKTIFENTEISIWDVDLSQIQATLQSLRDAGIYDLNAHLKRQPQAIWSLAASARFRRANGATLRLFGCSDASDLLSKLVRILGADGATILREGLCAIWNEAPHFKSEASLEKLDGTPFSAIVTFSLPQNFKQFESVPITVIDITQRKRAAAEVLKLQGYLANIINSMPSVLVGVDPDGLVTQWNQEAERVTGVTAEEAVGSRMLDVLPNPATTSRLAGEAIADRQERVLLSQFRQLGSKTRVEDVTIYPLIANGTEGAVIRIDDVTERYELEQQLLQSRKMDALGQLCGGIAHDFNNVLSGILGAAEMLQLPEVTFDADWTHNVDLIINSSMRAADLTSKLLAFGRKDAFAMRALDLHEVIDDVAAILSKTIDRKITLTVAKGALAHTVSGDYSALQNALLNIAINATHAMRSGGKLIISTRNRALDQSDCAASSFDLEPGLYIDILVSDTGEGISEHHLDRIFEPFFTTKGEGEGTGLGLAAVYSTMQNHQGAVAVRSVRGSGTTFELSIPFSEASKDIEVPADNGTTSHRSGTILLVEDEKTVRDVATQMLKTMGYTVLLATNGQEAVELFQSRAAQIDLVLMDMVMPVMDGRESFFKMKGIRGDVPIVISSGFSQDGHLSELRASGLAGEIAKPYTFLDLSQLLARLLDASC